MKGERNYQKGTKVWVEISVEGVLGNARPAEVISILYNNRLFEDKTHVLVRYLNTQGVGAYECIPSDRIIGVQEEQ